MSLKMILNKQTDFTGEFPAEYAASGLWRFNEVDAELRLRLDGHSPRQIAHFSGIDGAPGPAETEERDLAAGEAADGYHRAVTAA